MSPRRPEGEEGFTLVEMLVGMLLISVVMGIATSMVVAAQGSTRVTLAETDGVEEARLTLNRVSRELRQASRITRVVNADGPTRDEGALTAVEFEADFNDDGCIDGVRPDGTSAGCNPADPADPELLSYCHQPSSDPAVEPQLFVIRGALPAGTVSACTGGEPILAEDVAVFRLIYRSNLYRYDTTAPLGTTSWQELDAGNAPVGNQNGLLDVELDSLTTVVVELELQNPGLQLRTQVALRNRV